MTPDQKVQEKYRGNSTRSDLNPGPGKDKGQCPKKMKKLTEDGQKDHKEEHTREEPPQSPPEEEKGNLPYSYTPKLPPYPPPEDNDWETESLPRLVTPDEDQDTMTTRKRKSPEVPANQDADKDFFHDSERQLAA